MPVASDETLTSTIERLEILGLDTETPGKYNKVIKDAGERYTHRKRVEMERLLHQTKANTPFTILNLNCYPLKINGGVYFYDEVPACQTGKPWAIHVIENTRWGHKDNGTDMQNVMQMEPVPAMPSLIAGEYSRTFTSVICYEGKKDPSTLKNDDMVIVPEGINSSTGEFFIDRVQRKWGEVKNAAEKTRNATILQAVQEANSNYESEQHNLVGDKQRNMARHAVELGLMKELPRWVLISNLEPELPAPACPFCQAVPLKGAILCVNCGQTLDVLACFKLGKVKWNSDDMVRLTPEEYAEASEIHAARQKARGVKPS